MLNCLVVVWQSRCSCRPSTSSSVCLCSQAYVSSNCQFNWVFFSLASSYLFLPRCCNALCIILSDAFGFKRFLCLLNCCFSFYTFFMGLWSGLLKILCFAPLIFDVKVESERCGLCFGQGKRQRNWKYTLITFSVQPLQRFCFSPN
jgi:hypothetical protein